MNNRGAEKVLSVYWFVILILVAGGIFAMVYNFYHHPYDIREIEANIMLNKAADCISTGGKINSGVFENDFKDNFMKTCDLTFETEYEGPQYYLQVELGDGFSIEEGNQNLVSSCGLEAEVEEEKLAKCVERSFYSLDSAGNIYLIKILSIVRKTEKNVR